MAQRSPPSRGPGERRRPAGGIWQAGDALALYDAAAEQHAWFLNLAGAGAVSATGGDNIAGVVFVGPSTLEVRTRDGDVLTVELPARDRQEDRGEGEPVRRQLRVALQGGRGLLRTLNNEDWATHLSLHVQRA